MLEKLSLLDIIFFAYLLWSIYLGSSRGLGKELDKLLVTLLFLGGLLGIFVISQLSGLVKASIQWAMPNSGVLISLLSFIMALVLFFLLRKKISQFCETQFPGRLNHYAGAALGLLRSLSILSIIVLWLSYLPFGWFSESRKNSYIAAGLESFLQTLSPPTPIAAKSMPIQTKPPETPQAEELIIGY